MGRWRAQCQLSYTGLIMKGSATCLKRNLGITGHVLYTGLIMKGSATCLKRNLGITGHVLAENFYIPGDPNFKDLY